jgi:hypothetical protein
MLLVGIPWQTSLKREAEGQVGLKHEVGTHRRLPLGRRING